MKKKILLFLMLVPFFVQACGNAPATVVVDATQPSQVASPTSTSALEVPPAVDTATNTPPIVHVSIPSAGTSDRLTSHDHENSTTFASKKVINGDELYKNLYERPFTSIDMNYLPDVDIVNFSITSDDNFYYIKISFVGVNPSTQLLNGSYGVEVDRNADGRAEILFATHPPYTAEFSADNTIAYFDMNGDVGGSIINRPDDFASDGYEAVIFDLSRGVYPKDDPDFVWVRQVTDSELPAVEIAFKKWIFADGEQSFMWGVLSSAVSINPSIQYYHDHFTPEQAGAINTDDPNYVLKDLAGVDNTCRAPEGFEAVGTEPLGCYVKGLEIMRKAAPIADGAESTCGQLAELCSRIKDRYLLLTAQ